MNFIVTTENFLAGLKRVMNAVSSKPILPILTNILIEAADGQLYLTSYDTEMRIKTAVTAVVMNEGAITLQAKKLLDIISALPSGDIEVFNDVETPENVRICCQKSKFLMHGLSAAGYPEAPVFNEEWGFTIAGKELVDSLMKVSYARSSDVSRESLNGILCSIQSGMRTVAATDGRRLALVERPLEGDESSLPTRDGDFIMPYSVVCELVKSIDQNKEVKVHLAGSMAVFETGDTTIMCKLVEKQYPNYRSVIAANFNNKVSIPRSLFIEVLKRMRIVINENESNNGITLELNGSQMMISARSNEFGEANESIDVDYSGEPVSISFNPQYIADPLKTLSCDVFSICFNDCFTPVEITGDPGFIYILMPLRP
ncbi:MAG: DNA polymerase III subunit beta [Victivallales bacterium]|nr:DNA polymerase III subunit beta [Victivallales bacterium]